MCLNALPVPADWSLATGLESVGGIGIRLSYALAVYDNFDDNILDPSLWTEYDTGSNVNEINQRIEITGNNTWTGNGLVSIAKAIREDFQVKGTLTLNTLSNMQFGFSDQSTLKDMGSATYEGVLVHFAGNGAINVFKDGTGTLNVGSGYSAGNDYTVRIVYDNPGHRVYIQSSTDANYLTETLLLTNTTSMFSGSFRIHMGMYTLTGTANYFDDAEFSRYADNSPVATSPWMAYAGDAFDATDPIAIIENAIATILSLPSTGNIKYQYALNNGSFNGTWLTQAQLSTAIAGQTITNHTESLILMVQFPSDGTQAADISGFGSYVEDTGTSVCDYPAIADVRLGIVYDNSTKTGTLAVPPPGKVIKDIPTDNTVGTYLQVAEEDVEKDVQWGADGTEFTGTLAVFTATYELPQEVIIEDEEIIIIEGCD
jgi:hypothetical protein